jgi:hypothetical protein
MRRYFFDTRDNDAFLADEFGIEFRTLREARQEAARCLAEMAKEALQNSVVRELEVDIRDDSGQPLMRATLNFSVENANLEVGNPPRAERTPRR